jgi:hypothetical protein
MRTDGLTGLTVVAFSLLAAVWLSVAFGAVRPTVEAPVEDVHAQHVSMVEQMRREVSPRMVQEMNEPKWREMRQPGMIAQMEAHLRQADRLRGRP